MLISSVISSIRSNFSFSTYTNRKRPASTCNTSGHPLDQIITPKRMRKSQDEEVYTEHGTHAKSRSSKVWSLSSTLQESDTIDGEDDEGEIIVANVGEQKNVDYAAQPKKRPQADKHMTRLSYNIVPTGYVGVPVYDAIFNDDVTRDANGRCSKSSNSSVSEAEFTRLNPSTGKNCVSLLDKALYRDCLNSLVYPNNSIGADSPWPRKLQTSFSNSRQMPTVIVDKMNDSGVYQRKTTNKIPPVIDLTGQTENGEHLEIIGSKSSASGNKYTPKTNGIDHQRNPASASLASTRGILKTNVPASQLAEETGSRSKPIVERRRTNLDRKVYELYYLQDNYFANMKKVFNASDKVINQQVVLEETSKSTFESRRTNFNRKLYESRYLQDNYFVNMKMGFHGSDKVNAQQALQEETSEPIVGSRQMKLDRSCKYYILGRLQPREHGQGDLNIIEEKNKESAKVE